MSARTHPRDQTRTEIVEAAARLLQELGPSAVTTRGVAEAAGVQAPTLYRLFGDKDGLLEAVAEHVMDTFVQTKAADVRGAVDSATDPVEDLRAGWQTYLDFGLTNPTLFTLLTDPRRSAGSPAAQAGLQVLAARVHRLAEAGRLGTGEARAVALVHAAGVGTVSTLLGLPPEQRDPRLPQEMLEAVLRQVLHDPDPGAESTGTVPGIVPAAVRLRAHAEALTTLSPSERGLLVEWLDRVVEQED